MIANRFVSTESTFVDPAWWAACEHADARPLVKDPTLAAWVGVDASTKRDSTALVACTWDSEAKKVRMVWHRVFKPTPEEPLDFEATIEATLMELRGRFDLRAVYFDPYRMVSTAAHGGWASYA
jgi:hypothetical protein